MRLLHDIVEMFDKIRIDGFRGHEHHRDVLRLAGEQIALGNVLDMFADIGAHAREGAFARFVAARVLEQSEGLERKFGVDRQQPLVARQADDAIGPRFVGQRELEIIGAGRQAVAHDRLHPPLAEGAARLFVGENVFQRDDFLRQAGRGAPAPRRSPRGVR